MHLFYTPDITSDNYTLNEEESKHCIRVLRLAIGDTIELIDGRGGWYEAQIIDDNSKRCTVNIIKTEKEVGKRNSLLHLAIAPTKNMDRLEWFVEKATEIGINEISLINCDNSERTIVKTDRLIKVAISAIKQSYKAYLPQINEIIRFKQFVEAITGFEGQKFIAHCYPTQQIEKPHLKNIYGENNNVLILIGPEGDFSVEEVKFATDKGFKEIALGQSRLRTETAALYACTVISVLNEK
jgi:16S rRNA (uracil1498-N3)-methyltransferase